MIVGIDLGTTNSAAAIFENGESRLVPNALGDLLTPSAVAVLPLSVPTSTSSGTVKSWGDAH